MDYQNFLQAVDKLGFIPDQAHKDAAVKAVLGILASRMEEPGARRLTEHLPEPLSYEKLRSHQATPTQASFDEYLGVIGQEFKLDREQARRLVDTVLDATRSAIGEDTFREIEGQLPPDWKSALH